MKSSENLEFSRVEMWCPTTGLGVLGRSLAYYFQGAEDRAPEISWGALCRGSKQKRCRF